MVSRGGRRGTIITDSTGPPASTCVEGKLERGGRGAVHKATANKRGTYVVTVTESTQSKEQRCNSRAIKRTNVSVAVRGFRFRLVQAPPPIGLAKSPLDPRIYVVTTYVRISFFAMSSEDARARDLFIKVWDKRHGMTHLDFVHWRTPGSWASSSLLVAASTKRRSRRWARVSKSLLLQISRIPNRFCSFGSDPFFFFGIGRGFVGFFWDRTRGFFFRIGQVFLFLSVSDPYFEGEKSVSDHPYLYPKIRVQSKKKQSSEKLDKNR